MQPCRCTRRRQRGRSQTLAVPQRELHHLLADAQTSGGLLVAGEIPGAPVIGELRPLGEDLLVVR